jgi:hypothetical protein
MNEARTQPLRDVKQHFSRQLCVCASIASVRLIEHNTPDAAAAA